MRPAPQQVHLGAAAVSENRLNEGITNEELASHIGLLHSIDVLRGFRRKVGV
jgi:hypothetical protein